MNRPPEKRRKIVLTAEESSVLKWMFLKTLIPVVLIIAVSLTVLFFGLQLLVSRVSIGNYGISPSVFRQSASQFISAYTVIAGANIVLMVSLCIVVLYRILHDLVLPIMRITREMRRAIESGTKAVITVRKTDRLLIPLVEQINPLLRKL